MIKNIKIDKDGFFVSDTLSKKSKYVIDVPIAGSFYLPRFVDGSWVEGLTSVEISGIKNSSAIDDLNERRKHELELFIIDNIAFNEDIIKTMAVAYTVSVDSSVIDWISLDNSLVSFTKDELGLLIKKASSEVQRIYFKYRVLKDNIINGNI